MKKKEPEGARTATKRLISSWNKKEIQPNKKMYDHAEAKNK